MTGTPKGTLLIVAGPSGVGKSSLCKRLLREFGTLHMSISYTTRQPRGAEVDGAAYHFISVSEFESMVGRGEFAESAFVHGNHYGSSRGAISGVLDSGDDVLFDIDYQGARQLKEAFPNARAVLLMPPSMAILESRLRGRDTDGEDVIQRRLAAARHELSQFDLFDYAIVNDEFEHAYDALRGIYLSVRHQVGHLRPQLRALLSA
jgi:guanylate kinase